MIERAGAAPAGRMRLAMILCCGLVGMPACTRQQAPVSALTDQEFWTLSQTLSEPPGAFTLSDNLVSNEPHVAENARRLPAAGGVYIGVGPEQNFSYIARLRPSMAFIVDIRRENLILHLFYKALFELSADRADFVARLFSRPRPAGLGPESTAAGIFDQFDGMVPSAEQRQWNERVVRDWLVTTRGLPLDSNDLEWLSRIFTAFFTDGPSIQFWGRPDAAGSTPSFRRLMTTPDGSGQSRSFLATEEAFRVVKDLHARNMIVPVIGDFGGPQALRRVGDEVRKRGQVVTAFYGSNVAVYLSRRQMRTYCSSLAALPAARNAWFIERDSVRTLSSKLKTCAPDMR